MPDCTSCEPAATPFDMAAEEERVRALAHAAAWLITAYPDAWYFEDPAVLRDVTTRLVVLRERVDAGLVAR